MQASGGPIGALESLPLAVAMRHDLWLYPIVEVVHITGFVILVGSIVVLDLRLLGLSRTLSVRMLTRHVVPWSIAAFALIVPTGVMMFMAHASDLVSNRAFQLKLLLIMLAGVNAAAYHVGIHRSVARWDTQSAPPTAARLHALASLGLWLSVLACGRLLAYV